MRRRRRRDDVLGPEWYDSPVLKIAMVLTAVVAVVLIAVMIIG